MAIRKTVEFKGITVDNAYVRVDTLTIRPGNTRMDFVVNNMASAGHAPFYIYQEECGYALDGGNPIEQAYNYLKTLEGFHGSEDC